MKFEIKNRWTGEVQVTAEIECDESTRYSVRLGLAVRWAYRAKAVLRSADLSDADLSDADLSGADLRGADLRGADLRGADLRGADLRDAVLRSADLSDADLSDADLSDADLRGADLRGAVLRSADLSDADLSDADLSGADLRGADLRGADLRGADLRGADLRDADLSGADLRGADLRGADLRSFKADLWMILHGAQAEAPGLISALKEGRVDGSTYEGECACLVGTIANIRGVSVDGLERDSGRPAERWFAMIRKGDKPGDDSGGGFAALKALEWVEEYCVLAGIGIVPTHETQHEQ